MAEDLVSEFAGVAGAGNEQGYAVVVADAGDGEAEPSEFADVGLVRACPDDLFEDLAAVGALDLQVVELVGGVLDPGPQAAFLCLLAYPEAADVAAADPTEVLTAQAEDRAVVDHAAGFVAHGCVDDLAVGELADVAGDAGLHQQFGVGACDLVFTQGREVYGGGCLSAGPVLFGGAVIAEGVGEPVAVVFAEVAGDRSGARVKACVFGEFGF